MFSESALQQLDSEEILHLAINASQQQQHEKAIAMLKFSIEREEEPRSIYFLAAEYAEIALYHRAIGLMERALELAPDLHVCRFQLGLLLLMQQGIEPAERVWRSLFTKTQSDVGENGSVEHDSGESAAYGLFAQGMLSVARGESEQAKALIQQGLQSNVTNPSINKDMQGVLASLDAESVHNRHSLAASPSQARTDESLTHAHDKSYEEASDPVGQLNQKAELSETNDEAEHAKQHLLLSMYKSIQ